MNSYEIILIILGVICIVISSIVVDKSNKKRKINIDSDLDNLKNITEREISQLKNRVDELLAESSENIINKTEDYLIKLSNEKITALSEYSEEVLEKINRNHEEVVFIYQMLNDKEKQLKDIIVELQSIQLSPRKHEDDKVKDMDNVTSSNKNEQKIIFEHENDRNISNHNELILEEYKKGKSIIEISKSLGIGQGEVKLVVDLFNGIK